MSQCPKFVALNVNNTKDCSSRCSLEFSFGVGDCILKNETHYYSFLNYLPNTYKVQFNGNPYYIQDIRLYKQNFYNIHSLDIASNCTLFIHLTHGNKNLLLCIPIAVNNMVSNSKVFFDQILDFPEENKTKTYRIDNGFRLSSLIPKGAYYYFKDSTPYPPCTGSYSVILFTNIDMLNMSKKTYDKMNIKPLTLNNYTFTGHLYYNKQGTSHPDFNTGEDDIYIDCQPVETTEDGGEIPREDLLKLNERLKYPSSSTKIKKAEEKIIFWVIISLGIIFAVILMYFVSIYLLNKLKLKPTPTKPL